MSFLGDILCSKSNFMSFEANIKYSYNNKNTNNSLERSSPVYKMFFFSPCMGNIRDSNLIRDISYFKERNVMAYNINNT